MKILAIRGRNLASLSGEFALDFEAEPLRSSGLFAITGPTGAGKSTILDALCLALFDATPRLDARGGPEIGRAGDAERLPALGVLEGVLVRRAGDAERLGGHRRTSQLEGLHRPVGAGASALPGPGEPPGALVERRVGLGEAQTQDCGDRLGFIEGRNRYGGHAGFTNGHQREVPVVHGDAGGGQVDIQEIGPL